MERKLRKEQSEREKVKREGREDLDREGEKRGRRGRCDMRQ